MFNLITISEFWPLIDMNASLWNSVDLSELFIYIPERNIITKVMQNENLFVCFAIWDQCSSLYQYYIL